jgi:hypothetical protein
MNRFTFLVSIMVAVSAPPKLPSVSAAVIFESGTLGPTGITWQQALNGEVRASNVNSNVFSGVRFELLQPVAITQIGGHLVGPPGTLDTFFGAIVKLDDENDFPNSGDLSTSDVLGSTLIGFPEPSAEVFGDLSLPLDPGWYALVFGGELFGASGHGAMPLNNPDIGNPTYIAWQTGDGWANLLNPIFRNYRFVVQGTIVPEPTAIVLFSIALFSVFFVRNPNRR